MVSNTTLSIRVDEQAQEIETTKRDLGELTSRMNVMEAKLESIQAQLEALIAAMSKEEEFEKSPVQAVGASNSESPPNGVQLGVPLISSNMRWYLSGENFLINLTLIIMLSITSLIGAHS